MPVPSGIVVSRAFSGHERRENDEESHIRPRPESKGANEHPGVERVGYPPIKTSGSTVLKVDPTVEVQVGGQKPSHPLAQSAVTISFVRVAPLTPTRLERWKQTSPAAQPGGAVSALPPATGGMRGT